MRQNDKKLFSEKPVLNRMVNLRLTGYTVTSLGVIFACHHSSIENQCDRYGISPLGPIYSIQHIATETLFHLVPPEPKWEEVDGERVSRGKTYKEYIREAEFKRTLPRI